MLNRFDEREGRDVAHSGSVKTGWLGSSGREPPVGCDLGAHRSSLAVRPQPPVLCKHFLTPLSPSGRRRQQGPNGVSVVVGRCPGVHLLWLGATQSKQCCFSTISTTAIILPSIILLYHLRGFCLLAE